MALCEGVFWKSGFFRKVHCLEILEILEILKILESHQSLDQQVVDSDHLLESRDYNEFRDGGNWEVLFDMFHVLLVDVSFSEDLVA